MIRQITVALSVVFVAFSILLISVFRTASVKYDFSGPVSKESVLGDKDVNINYEMPYPGKVLPDSPLWPVKAFRDRVWLWVTNNDSREAELLLLFADKRVVSGKILFEKENYEVGYTTLTKAEKYLEQAANKEDEIRQAGGNTNELLDRLARASLKHFSIMQDMLEMAPEDAKPKIVETQNYAKRVYERSRNALNEVGETPPENPFDWR